MKIIVLVTLFNLAIASVSGQNWIGMNFRQINDYMNDNYREMTLQSVSNTEYSYMKYTNKLQNKTLLFFLGPDSLCSSVRLVADPALKKGIVKEYDSLYEKTSENEWTDRRNGKEYIIRMKEGSWSVDVGFELRK